MSGVGLGAGAWINLNPLNSGQIVRGLASMANSASTFAVAFAADVGTANYVLQLTISNIVDASVRHLTPTIIAKSSSGFSFQTQQATDHANYKCEYVLIKL